LVKKRFGVDRSRENLAARAAATTMLRHAAGAELIERPEHRFDGGSRVCVHRAVDDDGL